MNLNRYIVDASSLSLAEREILNEQLQNVCYICTPNIKYTFFEIMWDEDIGTLISCSPLLKNCIINH